MARTRSFVALIAAATLALTGCGGDAGGGELSWEDSPLQKYFSEVFTDGLAPDATDEERQRFYAEQQRKMEELVAQCMTEQGFEYVPYTPPVENPVPVEDTENMWRPDDKDWVEKYGYGAANNPWQERAPEPEPMPEPGQEFQDPNQEYVESLTESERDAYYEALHGKQQEPEPGEDFVEYDWEKAGCYGRANHEVNGDNPWDDPANKPIIEAMERFWQNMYNDPAFAALDGEWAACMTENGFGGFSKQADAQDSIYQQLNKYWENAPQGEGEQDPTFGTMKDPAYAAIAEQEIPLALADLTCREKTDYRQQQLKIQFAAEEQFIADNKEELDAMKARVEQGRK